MGKGTLKKQGVTPGQHRSGSPLASGQLSRASGPDATVRAPSGEGVSGGQEGEGCLCEVIDAMSVSYLWGF